MPDGTKEIQSIEVIGVKLKRGPCLSQGLISGLVSECQGISILCTGGSYYSMIKFFVLDILLI